MTSGAKSDARFGKQDFVYLYRYTNEEADKMLRRYWTNAGKHCSIKSQCTPGQSDGSRDGSTSIC